MMKTLTASLIGLVVVGGAFLAINLIFATDPPPTIRAEPGPIKQRPSDDANRSVQPRATRISIPQDARAEPAIDINLRLAR